MTIADLTSEAPPAGPLDPAHDPFTRTLHWLTLAFVLALYGLGLVWPLLPRGEVRHGMIVAHLSLGILFTAVLLIRLVWRLLPASSSQTHEGALGVAARAVHLLLYVLLIGQVLLGLSWRWASAEPLSFFGLFAIPAPFAIPHESRHLLGTLHYWTAHAIVALAAAHAGAALTHHYVWKDGVLLRMLPSRDRRR